MSRYHNLVVPVSLETNNRLVALKKVLEKRTGKRISKRSLIAGILTDFLDSVDKNIFLDKNNQPS